MTETRDEAVMAAHDFYNHHSTIQAASAELGIGWLDEAATAASLPDAGVLTVADLGVAAGRNSMRPMRVVVEALRRRTTTPIAVVHTDLPANDFSPLFETLERDPDAYLRGQAEVFPYAIGRSFYERLFAPGTVAVAWSATTTHWLSRLPTTEGDSIAANLCSPAVRARFAEQAADDWAAFLWARGEELAVGGRLVMVEPCSHRDGIVGDEAVQAAMDAVLADLVRDGLLTAEQRSAMRLPFWMRTPTEYIDPIDDVPHLTVVRSEVVEHGPNPIEEAYDASGDAEAFADAFTGAMRAWSESMLFGSPDVAGVADEFYRRYRALALASPDDLRLRNAHLVLDVERTATR